MTTPSPLAQSIPSPLPGTEPPRACPRGPRLVALREQLRVEHPDWWNAPVPALGDPNAWLGIIGLAPGKHGANRTGRPVTGASPGGVSSAARVELRAGRGQAA